MSAVRTERHGAVVVVEIHRPEVLNALNTEVLEGLSDALDALEANSEVRAVVLRGAGGKAFVAGADIAAMAELDPAAAERFATAGQRVLDRVAALHAPVIAAVGGFALGGGCELAMACDSVIASQRARFGQPEVKLGVIPGFGGTQRLVRRVGPAIALDLLPHGAMVGADEALRIGLVSRVVEGDVHEAALAVATEIAAVGPVAARLVKRAIHEGADGSLEAGLAAERSLFALCFATEDQKEGMAAFLEKRPAVFRGR